MSKTEEQYIKELFARGKEGLGYVVVHHLLRNLKRHGWFPKQEGTPEGAVSPVHPLEGLGPFDPNYTLEVQVDKGKYYRYPVRVRARVEYADSTEQQRGIDIVSGLAMVLMNLSVGEYEDKVNVQREERTVRAETRLTRLQDLSVLGFFYAIPGAVRYTGDGTQLTRDYNEAIRMIIERASRTPQDVGSSVLPSVTHP